MHSFHISFCGEAKLIVARVVSAARRARCRREFDSLNRLMSLTGIYSQKIIYGLYRVEPQRDYDALVAYRAIDGPGDL